jgi:hypothetical protein
LVLSSVVFLKAGKRRISGGEPCASWLSNNNYGTNLVTSYAVLSDALCFHW